MTEDNVREAIRMFNAGMIPLRAAAWCYVCHRSEQGAEVTSAELAGRLGIHPKSASRTLGELRRFARLDGPEVTESVTRGNRNGYQMDKRVTETVTDEVTDSVTRGNRYGYQTHQPVTEMVTPPTPPYKDFPPEEGFHTHNMAVTESVTCECDPSDDIRRAVRVLGGNIQTQALSDVLTRSAHLDRVRALASDGWRLESAARKFLDPCEVKSDIREARNTGNQLKYLLRIAEGLREPFGHAMAAGPAPNGPSSRRRGPDIDSMDFGD